MMIKRESWGGKENPERWTLGEKNINLFNTGEEKHSNHWGKKMKKVWAGRGSSVPLREKKGRKKALTKRKTEYRKMNKRQMEDREKVKKGGSLNGGHRTTRKAEPNRNNGGGECRHCIYGWMGGEGGPTRRNGREESEIPDLQGPLFVLENHNKGKKKKHN